TLAVDYRAAIERRAALQADLDSVFDRYDAILTPAAPGEAPHSLRTTGSPDFCVLWTLAGVPALSLPLLEGATGLPIGVQLIGRRNADGQLLRTGRWLARRVADMPSAR